MALDSRQKRMSVVGVGRPWLRTKMPSISNELAWRMASGLSYAGNAITGPPSTVIAWSEAAMIALITNDNATSAPSNYLMCDRSNFKVDELKTEWTGLMVRPEDYEERHPQETLGKAPHFHKDFGPQNPEPNLEFIDNDNPVSIDDL